MKVLGMVLAVFVVSGFASVMLGAVLAGLDSPRRQLSPMERARINRAIQEEADRIDREARETAERWRRERARRDAIRAASLTRKGA